MTDLARKTAEEIVKLNAYWNQRTWTEGQRIEAAECIISAHLPAPQLVEAREAMVMYICEKCPVESCGRDAPDDLRFNPAGVQLCCDCYAASRDSGWPSWEDAPTVAWQSTALARENEALRLALNLVAEYLEDEPIWNAIVPTGKPDIRDEMQTLGHVIEAALSRLTTPAGGA